MSNVYEERVTMIAAGEMQEFVPFGRDHCRRHPNATNLQLRQLQPASELWSSDGDAGLVGSLREVTIHEKQKESWQLRKGSCDVGEELDYDEELYVAGNMVIWSRGSKSHACSVYKAFTVDSPVLQLMYCIYLSAQEKQEKCVCIVQKSCVNVHTVDGKDYIAPLPFQVAGVWATRYGLIFERSNPVQEVPLSPPREPLPTMFSMLHPLDEIAPLVCRSGGKVDFGMTRIQYVADHTLKIVFSCSKPSIIMTYDTIQCLHTVWTLRKIKMEEQNTLLRYPGASGTPQNVATSSSLTAHLRSVSKGESPTASPFQNYSSFPSQSRSTISPGAHSRSHSPSISNMAALSRSHSPSLGASAFSSVQRFNLSAYMPSPKRDRTSNSPNSTLSDSLLIPETEPVIPELCLDHLWTETVLNMREKNSQASKVFITSDVCGQKFLCYLVESHHQLRCVKFEESNDLSQLIFGAVTVLQAKDAASVEVMPVGSNMGLSAKRFINVTLILGYVSFPPIGKVFIAGLPAPSLSVSNPMPRPSTPLDSISTPARSSTRHPGTLDEAAWLSPVPELIDCTKIHDSLYMEDCTFQQIGTYIHSLRDPVQNRVTLEMSNGALIRITTPELANSQLVKKCLQAIKYILPKEVAVQVLIKWYNTYNAPGGPNYHSEWNLFVTCLMNMMGYSTDRLTWTRNLDFEGSLSPVIAPKKARPSEGGTDEDWDYILTSDYHRNFESHLLASALHLDSMEVLHPKEEILQNLTLDSTMILFSHIPAIFFVLHLIYEELKLDSLMREGERSLVILLHQLARDLKQDAYMDFYWRDYPSLVKNLKQTCKIDQGTLLMHQPSFLTIDPPSIYHWLSSCLNGDVISPFPYLPGICERTKLVVLSFVLYILGDEKALSNEPSMYLVRISAEFTLKDLESLPFGVAIPIRDAIYHCREQPSSDWSQDACSLIGRQDLSKQAHEGNLHKTKSVRSCQSCFEAEEEEDGMNEMNPELMSLIWNEDLRVQEVRRLLQSAHPVRVNVVQMPEVNDHEYIEEKENRLLQLCQRTLALPVGRGMFTLFSYHPVPTEPLPIPKLNLTGRAPPRNTTVDLNSGNIDVPPNMASWASFHNGVAAGLKIAPASQIDSAWIVYNRQKNTELTNEYAGLLMALGLNGHLSKLTTMSIHDYLSKGHEMTSIGLLLGISAAKLGTMDISVTRLLSIHIPALLPPTSTELDVPHHLQVAAVMGVGLVYQGTAHRHIAEVLLTEIGRPPGPEMENCTDRESYSLAAGLALGMVCLGHGSNLIGMSDLNVPDQLYQYMVGGHRRSQPGVHREKHKSPSYQIKEGDTVNVDVTCPGATLALALLYLKTNNRSIADWLRAPDTQYLLDFVKPEFLLMRTLARGLIMWDEIKPNPTWINSNVPPVSSLSHINIIAGACMAMGLRFAGSSNAAAFNCLHKYIKMFLESVSAPAAALAGHHNLETCLSVVLLSLALVMAGTGNLKVLQLCRFMHKRTGGEMNYGFHMATHMALGLLFLGGGRYSLCTSNSAIAALLCALYPRFPAHSSDNRYHLQALRHLYVLATEPRLLVPIDVDTNTPCYALINVAYKASQWCEEMTVNLMAPTLLPELHLLKEVKAILSKDGFLYVKLRAGHLSYTEDPKGFRSLLAQTFTHRNPEFLSVKAVRRLERREMSETFELWQIKLVQQFYNSVCLQDKFKTNTGLLINPEFLLAMKSTLDKTLDQWLHGSGDVPLHSYLSGQPVEESQMNVLACFSVYHSIPTIRQIASIRLEGTSSFSELLVKFSQLHLPVQALLRLAPVILGSPQAMLL
uniref:Anaphase promoting complex subunit 1 n=1 Tax=Callorhinchus milii TaxID=7868 RepID=A0A4W3IWB9_CALMI